VLRQIVLMPQRTATAIGSFGGAGRANSEPVEAAVMTSGAPPSGFLNVRRATILKAHSDQQI
jgi:hypothetical protein